MNNPSRKWLKTIIRISLEACFCAIFLVSCGLYFIDGGKSISCFLSGGVMQQRHVMIPHQECAHYTKDGQKKCSDNRDCESACFPTKVPADYKKASAPVAGVCYGFKELPEEYYYISQGKIMYYACCSDF